MAEIYKSLGASASKAGLHKALESAGLADDTSYFAPVIPDIAGDANFRSFLHADGAGTKCLVAYLLYKETGDATYFASLAQDALVMNLDDIFCLGEPQNLQLSNLIARNAAVVGDDILAVILTRYRELAEELSSLGVPFQLAGGETADCGDIVRTLLVDAVLAGRIPVKNLHSTKNIASGDVIVGISSSGKSTYEKTENSGIGSNGLTLARHTLLHRQYRDKYPEARDANIPAEKTYIGPFKVTDSDPTLGKLTVGEALLSPTRTYAPLLCKLYRELGQELHAAIHLTGGGQTKALRFVPGKRIIKDSLFQAPPIFQLIEKHGGVGRKEMYQVFNMGHRLEVYLPEKHLAAVKDAAKSFGIEAKKIGHVENAAGAKAELVIHDSSGEFTYEC